MRFGAGKRCLAPPIPLSRDRELPKLARLVSGPKPQRGGALQRQDPRQRAERRHA
jgi:hypothetical protein